jgi:hypothetical protein
MKGRLISVSWVVESSILAFLQPLQGHGVLAEIDALRLLELGHQPVDDALVEVVAAEVGVAVGRLHLEHAVADLEDGNVEGAAAQVEDGDLLVGLLVQAVGEGGRGGLVDDALDVQSRDAPGVLGGLALAVVEVGGHGDDGLGHLLAQVVLGRLLHLLEDHGRDLGRRVLLAQGLHRHLAAAVGNDLVGHHGRLALDLVIGPAHEPLDREDRVGGVRDGLPLGHLPDQPFPLLGERNHRGRRAPSLRVGNDDGLAALHHRHAGVRGSEVDSDYLSHGDHLLFGYFTIKGGPPLEGCPPGTLGARGPFRNHDFGTLSRCRFPACGNSRPWGG